MNIRPEVIIIDDKMITQADKNRLHDAWMELNKMHPLRTNIHEQIFLDAELLASYVRS